MTKYQRLTKIGFYLFAALLAVWLICLALIAYFQAR